jgi:hypothetical protein
MPVSLIRRGTSRSFHFARTSTHRAAEPSTACPLATLSIAPATRAILAHAIQIASPAYAAHPSAIDPAVPTAAAERATFEPFCANF